MIEEIIAWRSFYEVIATTAASLTGLVFVGLSLNIRTMAAANYSDLWAIATQTFGNYLFAFMLATMFLIPASEPAGIAVPSLIIGGIGVLLTFYRLVKTARNPNRLWGRAGLINFLFPLAAYAFLAYATIPMLNNDLSHLNLMVTVMMLLLVSSTVSAFDLLVGVHIEKKTSQANRPQSEEE
jgi:hypothetical protein